MHYLRHRNMVRALKFGNIAFLLTKISALSFLLILVFLMVEQKVSAIVFLAISAGIAAIFGFFTLHFGVKARCQLCKTNLVFPIQCSKHSSAEQLLGSYHLRLCASLVFSNEFTCPYCGESFTTSLIEKSRYQKITPPLPLPERTGITRRGTCPEKRRR